MSTSVSAPRSGLPPAAGRLATAAQLICGAKRGVRYAGLCGARPCVIRTSRSSCIPGASVTYGLWSAASGLDRLHHVQVFGLLSRHEPDLDEIKRADEPVADAEPAGPGDGVPQRYRPVMLQQDERRGGVVGNFFEHVPLLRPREDVDAFRGGLLRAQGRPCFHSFFALDTEPDERAD